MSSSVSCRCLLDVAIARKLPSNRVTVDCGEAFLLFWNGGSIFFPTFFLGQGRPDDKLRIIFDMCDNDKNGSIDKKELSELLESLVDIAKTKKLSEENVNDLINSMFHSAGFKDKVGHHPHGSQGFIVSFRAKIWFDVTLGGVENGSLAMPLRANPYSLGFGQRN